MALADGARGRPRARRRPLGAQDGAPHAHVRRAAGFMAWSHTEPGHGCPISMTYAAVPGAARRRGAGQGVDAAAGLDDVRPRMRPAAEKRGALAGMGMTEKQGGSDVRANVTEAGRRRWTASTPCTGTSGSPRRR